MSWDEIAQLHKDGFEIGNHTRDHKGVTAKSIPDIAGAAWGHQRAVPGARYSADHQLRLSRQRVRQRRH